MTLAPWKKSYGKPRQHIKKQRYYFADKGLTSQSYGFSSSHVWMWELGHKESWAPKNWCFWTVVLEKTLENPLDWKEIKPVRLKGDQSWIFIGRTDAEAEVPILSPPVARNWLIGKDADAGKDWRQQERGTTEGERVGWYHWLWRWVWISSGSWWWTGKPGVLQSTTVAKSWTRLRDWTELIHIYIFPCMLSHFACVRPCDPVDCGPPGSSVHMIIQGRTLEWVAAPFSRGSSRPRDQNRVSRVFCIGRQALYH